MTHDTRLLALITRSVGYGFCLCLWAITGAGLSLIVCLLTGVLVLVCVERTKREVRE